MTFQEAYQAVKPIIGTKLYELFTDKDYDPEKGRIFILEFVVVGIINNQEGVKILAGDPESKCDDYVPFDIKDYRKTFFSTKEEAEQEKERLLKLVSDNKDFLERYFGE